MRKAPGQHRHRELHDRHRLRHGRAALAAAFLAFAPGPGVADTTWTAARRDGLSLRYDAQAWTEQAPPVPPSLLTLRCIAPVCSPGAVVTFVRDGRRLAMPGFGAFGPGAAAGAAVDLRVQSLTPGSRIRPRRPVEPVVVGAMSGYRGVYDIEDRALAKTGAIVLLLRQAGGTLEARMSAPDLSAGDIAAFERLTDGLDTAR
ncbi:hypothetical protein [Labrys monachus]|uniref:Invasion associated locus B family protein n=1 Tax=Labrys monachus TaxID=217067 RepID=A0ABU0FHF1_9HYPH|nr:hypothetical protein [Labrys monachus]MDQ0394028.1 hypothetical protein [Labrys monachus]